METCRECGSHDDVRHGRCVTCRAEGPLAKDALTHLPDEPDLEPAHDRPWVSRSAALLHNNRSPRKQ
ncbi:MAG: hypothetical protein AB7L13_05680 [Acidimicrobiia bacterium]